MEAAQAASRKEIRAHVASAVSARTIGNCLFAARLRFCAPLDRLYLHHETAKHGYPGIVKEATGEWNGILLSSVMRLGSVCMRVKDVHVYSIDLVSIIFWGAFVHDTQA